MKFFNKIDASAMQYALVIVMVIALLLGGLVLYAGMSSKMQVRFSMQYRLNDNVKSGLEYGKAHLNELSYDIKTDINLFDSELDHIALTKKKWGVFDYLISEAKLQNYEVKNIEMIGSFQSKMNYCLYLMDLGSSLALCGKTVIKGKVFLPKRGVKRAYIAGQNFIGERLVKGTVEISQKELPALSKSFLNQLHKPYQHEKTKWNVSDSMHQSFADIPLYYYSSQSITISNAIISGQIIIESEDSIFVSKSAQLNDVIVKAPVIYVEKGFVGSAQFIAQHKVTISEDVILKYPSVICVSENQNFSEKSSLTIGESTVVIGSILILSSINDFRQEVMLDIKENAAIYGLVYSDGNTQLKGSIHGSLTTKKFYLKTASSAYENHLLNATITDDLPVNFCMAPIFSDNYLNIALKCLN